MGLIQIQILIWIWIFVRHFLGLGLLELTSDEADEGGLLPVLSFTGDLVARSSLILMRGTAICCTAGSELKTEPTTYFFTTWNNKKKFHQKNKRKTYWGKMWPVQKTTGWLTISRPFSNWELTTLWYPPLFKLRAHTLWYPPLLKLTARNSLVPAPSQTESSQLSGTKGSK